MSISENYIESPDLEKSQNYLSTETLKQGMQFRKYQKRISNFKTSEIKEGFASQPTSYAKNSYSVLLQNNINDSDISNLKLTNQKYSTLLQQNPTQPDASQDINIDQTSSNLNSLAKNIASSTNDILKKTGNINSQIDSNRSTFSNTLQDYNNVKSANKESYLDNVRGIVKNSDIFVLQENYRYLMWSILAVGVVSLALNVLKK